MSGGARSHEPKIIIKCAICTRQIRGDQCQELKDGRIICVPCQFARKPSGNEPRMRERLHLECGGARWTRGAP